VPSGSLDVEHHGRQEELARDAVLLIGDTPSRLKHNNLISS